MGPVFCCKGFNDHDLDNGKTSLREKFNEIIKDLKENNRTIQGDIKLIKGEGDIKYFRAKLSDSDRLLFTIIKHNNEDTFVILEIILNHDYQKSKFLTSKEKIKNIEIESKEASDNVDTIEIEDTPQVHWLGKFITFSAKQEEIVNNAKDLPVVVSGSAGSGKTSVALEKLRKIEEEFKEGRILYIAKSENLIKRSKELYEYVYWDETANDFKIGIPDRIEFLSLHKFLEKQAEGIKGKKPVDRNSFFSWLNEICRKNKFKEYKKDGDKIFEEFTAVIAGGGLKKEEYKELGKRQAIFSEEKRNHVYGLFGEYKEFIEKDSKYYDPNLIANQCNKKKVYDAVVVDEVQDLTESTLGLILKSLKDESKDNFLLCGDVNQVVHPSFFSLSKLKSFLHKNTANKKISVCTLERNYRNSEQVIELANRILHLKNYCFASEDKLTVNRREAFFMTSDTKNTGNVSFIAKDKEQEMAEKVSESIDWAILVLDDESKQDARKLFGTPLVFNIHEAKGLEFENVILYKFTSHEAYNKVWDIIYSGAGKGEIKNAIKEIRDLYNAKNVRTSRSKDKEDKSFEEYKFYINALYVGVSRAIDSVYVIDDERNFLKIIKPERVSDVDIKKEESTPEEWRDIALKLIDEGNVEQAKGIAEKLLRERKGGYAKEIMSALKAKEKDYAQKSQLPLGKNEQAVSELKTENPTQESLMGKSSIPEEKFRKRNGQQNQNEEKKLKRLEENTKELFSALENGDLQKAKKLIKKGVDVNATTSEEGDTPLHVAAYNGYESIAELLLKHRAKVDATSKDGSTPLHLAVDKGHERVVELLLEKKANINPTDEDRNTPLFVAAANGRECVAKLLLERGANVYDSNKNGYTPLHVAAQEGHKHVAQLLLKHGANIDATTSEKGYTPLHVAAQKGHKHVAVLFLRNGADANAKDSKNYTPLHDAAQRGSKDTVQLLLDHGADINAFTNSYATPSLLALQYSHSEVLDLLLADPNINAGHVSYRPIIKKNERDHDRYNIKSEQDTNLFDKVKEAANEKDKGKLDILLKKIKDSLKPENKYGFKPGLNCSPDVGGVTTIEIAIEAGGKLLQLLYDYAKNNIDTDTEIFKRLKQAKEQQENSQPKSSLNDVSCNLAQAQTSIT